MKLNIATFLIILNKTVRSEFFQEACPYEGSDCRLQKQHPYVRGLATTAIIDNGVIMLGIHDEGHLNVDGDADALGETDVGLRYFRDGAWYDSTAYGCTCEGYGVSYKDMDTGGESWGGANDASGIYGITGQSMTNNGTEATTTADVSSLRVQHHFYPSPETDNLYTVEVKLENIGTNTISELRYRRTMDWDIPPTIFNECVSIFFADVPLSLEYATDDGFEGPNPLSDDSNSGIQFSCPGGSGCPVYDSGPDDHGALFQFLFKNDDGSMVSLTPGENYTFKVFYGAAPNKDEGENLLSLVGAEIVSFGYPPLDGVCTGDGAPNVFMFGFKGVGGDPVYTSSPTLAPTAVPTEAPTSEPTLAPTAVPTLAPTLSPTSEPTSEPTSLPTSYPTFVPTEAPTSEPTSSPDCGVPTAAPTPLPVCDENCHDMFYKPYKNGDGGCKRSCEHLAGLSAKEKKRLCNSDEVGLGLKPAGEICIETCENFKTIMVGKKIRTCLWLSLAKESKINRLCGNDDISMVCYKTCGTCPKDWGI